MFYCAGLSFDSRQLTRRTAIMIVPNVPWFFFKQNVPKKWLQNMSIHAIMLQQRSQSHLVLFCWNNDGHDFSDPGSWPVGPLRHSHEPRAHHLGIVQLLSTAFWLHHHFLLTKRSKFLSIWKREERTWHSQKKTVNTAVFVVFQWRHAPRLSIHVARRCFLHSCASARDQTRCGDKHPPPQPRSRHNRASVTYKKS